VLLLADERSLAADAAVRTPELARAIAAARARLEAAGID
jgi:hypothetical protein